MIQSEILSRVIKAASVFDYNSTYGSTNSYDAKGLNSVREVVDLLDPTPILKNELLNIKNAIWFDKINNIYTISSIDDTNIKQLYSKIVTIENALQEIEDQHFVETNHVIQVYLPSIYSISDLQDISNTLKKAVEIPSAEFGGNANIITAFPGSILLEIVIGSSAAMVAIGKIVKIAISIKAENAKANAFQAYAESINLNNELQRGFVQAQNAVIKNLVEEGVVDIGKELEEDKDLQRIGRFRLAINSMAELYQKGVRVLVSPKEDPAIKALFEEKETGTSLLSTETVHKQLNKPDN